MPSEPTRVYLEVGRKRVFACAMDWPGWCRSARDEGGALETLAAYADRYAPIAQSAKLRFTSPAVTTFDVIERLPGSGGTDFGVPGEVPDADREPLDRKEAARLAKVVVAAWKFLADVVAEAPAELRKGPRGGGRDRDKIVEHVLEAEATAYARKIGVRMPEPRAADASAVDALHNAMLDALRTLPEGRAPNEKGWPVRYAARRIAWHAIDHAWEIQDRQT